MLSRAASSTPRQVRLVATLSQPVSPCLGPAGSACLACLPACLLCLPSSVPRLPAAGLANTAFKFGNKMGATSTLQRTATGVTDPVEEPGSPERDAGGDGGQPEVTSPHRMAQTAAATITMRTAAAEATAGGGGEPGATKQVRWLVRRSKSGGAYPRCYCCYVEEPHPQRANHGCTGGRAHANGCRRRRGKQWQRCRAWRQAHGTGALRGLLAYICWNTPGVVVLWFLTQLIPCCAGGTATAQAAAAGRGG